MGSSPGHHKTAAAAILASAVAWAFVPPIIHWTLRGGSPLVFTAISEIVVYSMAFLFLLLLKRRVRLYPKLSIRRELTDRRFYLTRLKKVKDDEAELVTASNPSDLIRLPFVMILLGGTTIFFLSAATQFIETAIAASLYETWPIFVVYGLAKFGDVDYTYLHGQQAPSRSVKTEHITLSLIATLGLLFMLLSQVEDEVLGPRGLLSLRSLFGCTLAMLSAITTALNVNGSIIFGKTFYYSLRERGTVPVQANPKNPQDGFRDTNNAGAQQASMLVLASLLPLIVSRIITVPVSLLFAFATSERLGLPTIALIGAILMGIAHVLAVILVRVGNLLKATPAINALAYFAPVLTLTILAISGIELYRFDLFLMGAGLVIGINILIQLKPDQERDVAKFGVESRSGTRFGFTVLIISLWTFGTVIYLRDELWPEHWLEWPVGEYWGLIGLSATVFTLILGFRVTRLGDRTKEEDVLMLSLFRDAERLEALGLFGEINGNFCKKLSELDRAPAKELLVKYNAVHQDLRAARQSEAGKMHMDSIVALQKQLDSFAHSKQQGRDIVELFALISFAFVTIGLGLLARQTPLGSIDATAWSGFLSDVFVLLFVSTVAFLMMNLFDLRRERETALLVPVEQHGGEYGLFFRNKQRLAAHLVGAILISVVMAGLFIGLLYDKWLG